MIKTYAGPTPFNIYVSGTGETTINVAENDDISLGPLGGDYAKTHPDALSLAKQQVAGFLATISAGEPIASLTKLKMNLNILYNECAGKTVYSAKSRDDKVKNIIHLCAAQANVAFPAVGADTQALRDAIGTGVLVDGRTILASKSGDKIALAVAAFYNIRRAILIKITTTKSSSPFNILSGFAGGEATPLPTDLTDDISTIKTVIALVTDAIKNNTNTLNTSTNTANKIATDARKEVAKKTADDAAKKLVEDANKLVENKKAAAQKIIDASFNVVQDKNFDDASDAAKTAAAAAAAGPAAAGPADPDIAMVLPITTLKAAVRTPVTTGIPDTLPGGVTYVAAEKAFDEITTKLAGAGAGGGGASPLLTTAKAWFEAYAIVALAAKNAADAVLVGGARKNTRRRSYSHGGRRKSYRRRRY